jgi:hypothetical protein
VALTTHPPPSAEVENEHSYTSTPLLGPWWSVIGRPLPLLGTHHILHVSGIRLNIARGFAKFRQRIYPSLSLSVLQSIRSSVLPHGITRPLIDVFL